MRERAFLIPCQLDKISWGTPRRPTVSFAKELLSVPIRAFLFLCAFLVLIGCGYQPLRDSSDAASIESILIITPPERNGVQFALALRRALSIKPLPRPQTPYRYILQTDIAYTEQTNFSTSKGETKVARGIADLTLVEISSGEILLDRRILAASDVRTSLPPGRSRRQTTNHQRRIMDDLADQASRIVRAWSANSLVAEQDGPTS